MLLVAPPPKLAPTLSSFGLGSFAIVANARASLLNICLCFLLTRVTVDLIYGIT